MCINATPDGLITVNGGTCDCAEEFGSLVSKDNAAQKDIRTMLGESKSKAK